MNSKKNGMITILFICFITFVIAVMIVPNMSSNLSMTGKISIGGAFVPEGAVAIWLAPIAIIIAVMSIIIMLNMQKSRKESMI